MAKVSKGPSYILCKKNCFSFITAGMYYEVVKYASNGDVTVIDNKSEEHIFTLNKFFHTGRAHLLAELFNTIEDED